MKAIVKCFVLFLCLFVMNPTQGNAQIIIQDIINLRIKSPSTSGIAVIDRQPSLIPVKQIAKSSQNRLDKLSLWTIADKKGQVIMKKRNDSNSLILQAINSLPVGIYEVRKNNRLITTFNKS